MGLQPGSGASRHRPAALSDQLRLAVSNAPAAASSLPAVCGHHLGCQVSSSVCRTSAFASPGGVYGELNCSA